MKWVIIFGFLFFNFDAYSFENIYVRPTVDKKASHFVATELVLILKDSINEYNLKRDHLPEIKKQNYKYTITQDKSTLEFTTKMFYQKTFLLNNQLIHFYSIEDLNNLLPKNATTFFSIINDAYADFAENNQANRILIASIISLANNIEDKGYFCYISCKTPQINFNKISEKIKKYQSECEDALSVQEEKLDHAEQINYYSTLKTLADPNFNEAQSIHALFSQMGQFSDDKLDASSLINNKLGANLNENSCELQFRPFLKSGLNNISHYNKGNAYQVDTVAIPSFCKRLNSLKQCLDDLYTQNKSITQTMKKHNEYIPSANYGKNLESATGIGK